MRQALLILLFIYSLIVATLLSLKATKKFTIYKITSLLPHNDQWEIFPFTKQADEILDQSFHYFSKGAQCFVFESEDKKYILKFPNHMRLCNYPFFPFFKELQQKRYLESFTSYETAYKYYKNESGLIYLHLNAFDLVTKKVLLISPIGSKHWVDLKKVPFILQKKAEPFYPYLLSLNEEKQKEALRSFLELILLKNPPGIASRDLRVHLNFGFIDGKAVKIDAGSLKKMPEQEAKEYNKSHTKWEIQKMGSWIEKNISEEMGIWFKEEAYLIQ